MSDSATQPSDGAAADDSIRALARPITAIVATWSLSYASMFTQPQFLGSIMSELDVGEAAAGRMVAFENAAYFITMLVAAGPLARWSRVRAALVGGLVVALANVASGFASSFDWLMVTRLVAGMACGLVGATGTASAVASSNPSRVFAAATFFWGAATALEQLVVPFAIAPYGFGGGYFVLASICPPLMAAFIWLLPPLDGPKQHVSMRTAPNRMLAFIAMLMLLIYEVGQSGVYTFIAQVGGRSGLGEIAIGGTLSWTRFAGLSGAVLAIWVGGHVWRKWPVIVGMITNATVAIALALCTDKTLYTLLNLVWVAGYYFFVPFMMGTLARLDKLGRWAVASDACWNGGTFVGPAVAGWLVETGGYGSLAGLATAAGLTAVIILIALLNRVSALDD